MDRWGACIGFGILGIVCNAHAQPSGSVDLLHRTGAAVGVSSEVENDKDMPDALIDGDVSTAWQSRTGDLKGAWISFRVAPDARIKRIGLIPGLVKTTEKDDLFTANYRVSKVRISAYADGALVGELAVQGKLGKKAPHCRGYVGPLGVRDKLADISAPRRTKPAMQCDESDEGAECVQDRHAWSDNGQAQRPYFELVRTHWRDGVPSIE